MFGKSASWWLGENSVFGLGVKKTKETFTKENKKKASGWLGDFIEDVNPQIEGELAPENMVMLIVGIVVLSRFI